MSGNLVSWGGQYSEIRSGEYGLVVMGRVFIFVRGYKEQIRSCVGRSYDVLDFMRSAIERCADEYEIQDLERLIEAGEIWQGEG
jgi:hypothetical protein